MSKNTKSIILEMVGTFVYLPNIVATRAVQIY